MVFVGEDGIDTGGLTREFFRLIAASFSQKYLDSTGCFKRNAIAFQVSKFECILWICLPLAYFQEGVYGRVGTLAAMSLINGGASFSLFSHTVFYFLCGCDAAKLHPKIEEVPVANTACKDFLYKVGISYIHTHVYKYVMHIIMYIIKYGSD